MSSKGIALVTGAGQGMGRTIALRLADDGFDVAVNDVSPNSEKLETLVAEIQKKGRASVKCVADVSQDGQVRDMVEMVVQQLGGLDVMVANAGVVGLAKVPLTETSSEEWDRVMNVNARGVFHCYKYAAEQMIKQGRGGRIIGASSVAGKKALLLQAPYSASKFAVRGLTQSAALEWGEHGIRVNAYAPGAIDTPMMTQADGTGTSEGILNRFKKLSPLNTVGTPEDIANLVSFLASKESQFITAPVLTPPLPISIMSSKGIVLVTGAAQGIGRAVALRLADDGFDVAVNDVAVNAEKLETLVDEIQKKGRASSSCIADVSKEDEVKKMVEIVAEKHGSLDVMIANAGIVGRNAPLTEVTVEEWDRIMNINARGCFLCYKYAGLQMIKQGRGGRIIGASSFAGKRGGETQGPYSASKFAIRGLTQAAAQELGPYNVTVNAYAPGAVETAMLTQGTSPAVLAMLKEMSPLKKLGVPEDIASLVSFLASQESQFITGQSISINGGIFFD
ncbi:NAD(P)-binding protein [Mycena latifolia]|nr:NAD(P)-binding protein [Mycena latifolia]